MPTVTFPIAVAGDDGSVVYSHTAWPPNGGTFTAGTNLYLSKDGGATKYNDVSCVRFDTSSVPDNATVTAASLALYCGSKSDNATSNYSVVADYYDFGGSPTVPGDWIETASPSIWTAVDLGSVTANAINTFTLTNLTGISKTGYTGIRITFSAGAPTGTNELSIASYEDANQEPRLTVTYTVPATTQTGIAQISLAAGQPPANRTGHSFIVRARKTNAAHTGTVRATLYEGVTTRSGLLETAALTTSFADYVLTVADPDAASITSYTNLAVWLYGYSSTGTPTVFEVAEARLIVPDAAPALQTGEAQISLQSGQTPTTRTNHQIVIRARQTSLVQTGILRVTLYEGNTARSAVLETASLTTSLTDYTLAVADVDAAMIGSYSDLAVRFYGYSTNTVAGTQPYGNSTYGAGVYGGSGGSDTVAFEVANVKMLLPDASAVSSFVPRTIIFDLFPRTGTGGTFGTADYGTGTYGG